MRDPAKIKDLLLEKVDLAEVMLSYHVHFVFHPGHADEVQYRCQFHGRGDTKPSARYYRHTNSCYCWVCRKSWNVIDFIMEKETLAFHPALKYMVAKYKIDLSSIPDEPEFSGEKKEEKEKKKEPSETAIRMECLHRALLRMRGKLPFEKYNVLCVYFLSTAFRVDKGEDVVESLIKLESKIGEVTQCLTIKS